MRQSWVQGDEVTTYKKTSTAKYIEQLRQSIDRALAAAGVNVEAAHRRNKAQYDKRCCVSHE